jgi:uncharacterized protein
MKGAHLLKFKNRFFKITFLSAILIFCGALVNFRADINLPGATDEFYVNDFANVLSQETKQYILNNSNALDKKTSAQIVVATVDSLEGTDVENYAISLFRKWGIGDKEKDNGVLILLAPSERKARIEVGYGLEGKINDAKAGRFLDEYAVPYFKNDNWDQGIKTLYSALVSEVYSEYDMDMPEDVSNVIASHNETYESSQVSTVIGLIVIAIIVVFGGILPFIIRRKNHKGPFIDDNPGGFWGMGGDFGSDGFGGFSGGGGSSGGGGASRGF